MDFERGQKRKLNDRHKSAPLRQEPIILATDVARKDEVDVEDFFEPELFAELVNKAYGLSDQDALAVEKLIEADQGPHRLVKKAEAYFRLLPQNIPAENVATP
jgi:hypothetical protein